MPLANVLAMVAVEQLIAALTPRQAGVRAATGKYRQLHRGRSWGAWEGQKPNGALVSTWVDEYVGPQGPGYIVCGEVIEAGIKYQHRDHVGPERYRDVVGWQQVQEG